MLGLSKNVGLVIFDNIRCTHARQSVGSGKSGIAETGSLFVSDELIDKKFVFDKAVLEE